MKNKRYAIGLAIGLVLVLAVVGFALKSPSAPDRDKICVISEDQYAHVDRYVAVLESELRELYNPSSIFSADFTYNNERCWFVVRVWGSTIMSNGNWSLASSIDFRVNDKAVFVDKVSFISSGQFQAEFAKMHAKRVQNVIGGVLAAL